VEEKRKVSRKECLAGSGASWLNRADFRELVSRNVLSGRQDHNKKNFTEDVKQQLLYACGQRPIVSSFRLALQRSLAVHRAHDSEDLHKKPDLF